MTARQTYHETLAKTLIANLAKRNMTGYYCPTIAEARKKALSFVNAGDTVSYGGSESLNESGIYAALKERTDITFLDRTAVEPGEPLENLFRQSFSADCYFMSTNALSQDGQLVNIDGRGNRVSCLIFGPKKVVLIVGMNKVAPNLEDAVTRARNLASPPNCTRLHLDTPCTKTGHCMDCYVEDCICNQFVITRRSKLPDRIHVILVGENLGF